MSIRDKMHPIDDFLSYLFLLLTLVVEIVLSLGFGFTDVLVFTIPLVGFVLWVLLYIYGYRAKILFRDDDELFFIENARTVIYFFTLLVAIILNTVLVFTPGVELRIPLMIGVSGFLLFIEVIIPKAFFRTEMSLFNETQNELFIKLLSRVGSVSIYFSMFIAVSDQIILEIVKKPFVTNILYFVVAIPTIGVLVFLVYWRENSSRKYAIELADSLEATNWKTKFEREKRLEQRRERKRRDSDKSIRRNRRK